jgi:hypothetical protein
MHKREGVVTLAINELEPRWIADGNYTLTVKANRRADGNARRLDAPWLAEKRLRAAGPLRMFTRGSDRFLENSLGGGTQQGQIPMIKSLVIAAALTVGLANYALRRVQ